MSPDVLVEENSANLGIIGDIGEPLLSVALELINTDRRNSIFNEEIEFIGDSNSLNILDKEMYISINNYTKFAKYYEEKK